MRRATGFLIGASTVAALAGTVISSSHTIAQRAETIISNENEDRVEFSAIANGPVPGVSCPPCSFPEPLTQGFDNLIPPVLPPGWSATNTQGPPPLWETSDNGVPVPPADTLPNAAFIDDPEVVSDKRLEWQFSSESFEVTFRQNFNMEASEVDPDLGFDGGVLELSTDGGITFQDILDAGGSFVQGGYNRVIASDRGSPIAGRQAWSGNSGGFITTIVDLLTQAGILRWRMASDNSGSGEGWRVDAVSVIFCKPIPASDGPTPPCGSTPTPPITPTPPPITPTPTATATATRTPTPIPTATPTATPRVTPRPRPTPLPRPTPR
ncbi:MAG TPA: hypothetical protein VFQ83_05660 [Candidatus Udaeobacter sp.]|nr:hypothetical protein [Candidatus Udaeobacter sp.]